MFVSLSANTINFGDYLHSVWLGGVYTDIVKANLIHTP